MSKLDKVKTHLKNHAHIYIGAVGCVAVGVIGGMIVSTHSTSAGEIVQKITQFGFRNEANTVVINLVEHSTPSKPVHLVGTNLYFNSLSEAARETGHHLSSISKCVNGHIPDVNGDVFQLLERAA